MFKSKIRRWISSILICSLLQAQIAPSVWAQPKEGEEAESLSPSIPFIVDFEGLPKNGDDPRLVLQYQTLLTQMQTRFSKFGALNDLNLDGLLETFERQIDTPETRDLLSRMHRMVQSLYHSPYSLRGMEPHIQQLVEWENSLYRLRGSRLLANLGNPPAHEARGLFHVADRFQACCMTYYITTILLALGYMFCFGMIASQTFDGDLFPTVCRHNASLPGCNRRPWFCLECPVGEPPVWVQLPTEPNRVPDAYPIFTPEAKVRFWCLEFGIPAAVLLWPLLICAGKRGLNELRLGTDSLRARRVRDQIAQIEQLRDGLFEELSRVTQIPALRELSEALTLPFLLKTPAVEIQDLEEVAGAGAEFPSGI